MSVDYENLRISADDILEHPAMTGPWKVAPQPQESAGGRHEGRSPSNVEAPPEAAFHATLQEYAGLLTRIAGSYEAEPALRDDLLQEIALALWKALPTRRGESSLKTFVARVAHNRGASHVLKRTRHPMSSDIDDNLIDTLQDPQHHAQLQQKRARLDDAVHALPMTYRQVVTLALEGFTQREIADTLGIRVNNVAVRLNRARKALKNILGESA